eukprot:443701_1
MMSSSPSPKRRKLNDHSYVTVKPCPVDLDGVLSLTEALLMERQCMVSLLKFRKNIESTESNKFIEWIFKIKAEQTSIVTALKQCFEANLNSIQSLKQINTILDKERSDLIALLNQNVINNMNGTPHDHVHTATTQNIDPNGHNCYDLMQKRMAIIQQLMDNNKRHPTVTDSKQHDKHEEDDNEDVDLEVLQADKAKRCPLTQSIIKIPKRSIQCNHIFECFAIIDYIVNKATNIYYFAEIQCPVCKHKITLNDLITDYSIIRDVCPMDTVHTCAREDRILDLTEEPQETHSNHNTSTCIVNLNQDHIEPQPKPVDTVPK